MYISGPVVGDNFINRQKILADLQQHAAQRQYCCLIGLRRTGKTSVMIKAMDNLPPEWLGCYFNVQTSIAVPEQFATIYIGSILFWVLHHQKLADEASLPQFFDLLYTQRQALQLNSRPVDEYLLEVASVLERRELNYGQILQLAFSFPQVLTDALGRPVAVFIDEFQDIVQMDAYGLETLKLFRSITQMQSVWYCLAGSSISLLNSLVNDKESPLYGQYKTYLVGSFDLEAARELITRQAGQPLPESIVRIIYEFTGGYPFYLAVMAGATAAAVQGGPVDEDAVIAAIVNEVCSPTGTIATHCRQVFNTMLRMATQSTVSRQVMYYLSHNEPDTAAGVARYVGRSPDFIRQILQKMVETDLLTYQNRRYSITDPVLAFWLRKSYFDIEVNPLAQIHLEETKQRLTQELRREILPS